MLPKGAPNQHACASCCCWCCCVRGQLQRLFTAAVARCVLIMALNSSMSDVVMITLPHAALAAMNALQQEGHSSSMGIECALVLLLESKGGCTAPCQPTQKRLQPHPCQLQRQHYARDPPPPKKPSHAATCNHMLIVVVACAALQMSPPPPPTTPARFVRQHVALTQTVLLAL